MSQGNLLFETKENKTIKNRDFVSEILVCGNCIGEKYLSYDICCREYEVAISLVFSIP